MGPCVGVSGRVAPRGVDGTRPAELGRQLIPPRSLPPNWMGTRPQHESGSRRVAWPKRAWTLG